MCAVDYGEPCDFMRKLERTARKDHKCSECGRVIAKGESYEYVTGKGDGYIFDAKTCTHCMWARQWLVVQCDGFLYHGVFEDLEEHWTEEPILRSLDLGRRIVGMKRRWRRRDGELIRIPEAAA